MSKKEFDVFFVNKQTSLASLITYFYENRISADTLLNYKNNKQRIYSKYDDEERKQYSAGVATLVKAGTLLDLPREGRVLTLKFESYDITPTNINELETPYISGEMQDFLSKRLNVQEFGLDKNQLYVKRFNRIYAKIYSRALDKVIYLTPFIEGGSLQVGSIGGGFALTLQGISYFEDKNGEIQMSAIKYGKEFLSKTTSKNKENKLYFKKVLNPQDLIFIKLEDPFVQGEEEYINVDTDDDYDMIGIVDKVGVSERIDTEKITISVNIQGRDLIKIFVEDGTHFFPFQFFVTEGGDEKGANRNFFANKMTDQYATRIFGALNAIELQGNHSIREMMNFIVSKLRIMTLGLQNGNNKTFTEGIEEQGIWNFIEVCVEPNVANRVMYDSTILTMQGSILNFIKRILQDPFVELISDTIGNKFRLIARTPPTLKETFIKNPTLNVSKKYMITSDLETSDETAYSWFFLRPNANFFGDPNVSALMFPAIGFPKLLELYGSRKYEQQHNYVYYNTNDPLQIEAQLDSKVQNIEDLVWMVKSFIIEPFLEKGTMTFQNIAGLKRGMNLYIPETDMLYYIESYNHHHTVTERTTTVTVSRGMRKSKIDKYFDLVQIEVDQEKRMVKDATMNLEIFKELFGKLNA